MKRHLVRAALSAAVVIVVVAGLAGCQPPKNSQADAPPITRPVSDSPIVRTAPAATTAPDASEGTAEALKFKAQNWANELEPLMNKRAGTKGEPSVADFMNPDDLRIGPAGLAKRAEPEPRVVAIADPQVVHSPTVTNQTVALAPDRTAAERASVGTANAGRIVADTAVNERPLLSRSPKETAGPTAGDLDLRISKNVKDYPKDVSAQLDYQLLEFLKDKPTPQLDVMARLSAEDRELLSAILDGLANVRNGIRADNNMLMSRKVRPLLDLADRLRAQADLIIPAMALCTRVDGFGVYEPIEPARFTAMREHAIIVYCEVENFSSHLTDKKLWETRLSQEVVLYTETGLPIWKDRTENIPDLARNRRHDFFVVKKTKFPANITIGRYLLKVTIVDQQASRVAEATIPVQFVAQ
jgi:hypothetical protein